MAYKRVYVDSDVILDMLLEREPFYKQSLLLFIKSTVGEFSLCTSVLVVANVNYVSSRKIGKVAAKEEIKKLSARIEFLTFDSNAISFAVDSNFTDFEDAIQNFIATDNNCDVIITRNVKDYKNSTIPVLTAEQFLRTIL